MKVNILSLFCGVGGIDIGFEKAGFSTIYATDNWDIACQSFKHNFPECEVINDDIINIDYNRFNNVDGIIGGPPCPPFSKSRFYRKEKSRGLEDVEGKKTITNYFLAIERLEPKFFLFENVHGFTYKPHRSALEFLENESDKLGYKTFHKVLNSADYGVPQVRKRFICVGIKKSLNNFTFPYPSHSGPSNSNKDTENWITCGEVLNDIDIILDDDKKMQAGSKHKSLLKLVPPGSNYLHFTKERNYPNPIFKWRSRYWSFLLKLSPDKPSWTIQASHSNNMGPFHWRNRFLRINEIKRLQSFDDDTIVKGSYKDQWRQIGNAVPPKLAEAVAVEIKKQYFT
jgi:DNA (cytosine-5)-methyltransferase 1